jgi:hypothetical protein
MSHLPMEMQGSFIDGGAGPLTSEDTPGAFRAQGRAFGEIPDWARDLPNNALSGTVPYGQASGSASDQLERQLGIDRHDTLLL